ncbi:MAG: c-type cytochrome [Pseudomonadota bacterium]
MRPASAFLFPFLLTALLVLSTGLATAGGPPDTPSDSPVPPLPDSPENAPYLQGSIDQGRTIAQTTCLNCHTEFAGDPAPNPAVPNAPPLASFGQKWPLENLQEALAEGITVGHDATMMPEFSLAPETIADLLAYLGDLTTRANSQPR